MTRVPERFARRILKHAIAASVRDLHPLFLAVQGPAGTGKSFQVRACLEQYGFIPIVESGAALSGEWEGESLKHANNLLSRCEQVAAQTGRQTVAIIEDFELSPAGRQPDTRYTVNSQLLSGFLMNLADNPDAFRLTTGLRVPVILTGNDFTTLHGPLSRPGRMDFFTWIPAPSEFQIMLSSVFETSGIRCSPAELVSIVNQHPNLSVAHFAAAASDAIAERLYLSAVHSGVDLDAARRFAASAGAVSMNEVRVAIARLVERESTPLNLL